MDAQYARRSVKGGALASTDFVSGRVVFLKRGSWRGKTVVFTCKNGSTAARACRRMLEPRDAYRGEGPSRKVARWRLRRVGLTQARWNGEMVWSRAPCWRLGKSKRSCVMKQSYPDLTL